MKSHVDVLQWTLVSGWIFEPGKRFTVQIWRGSDCIETVQPDGKRIDVAAHFPGVDAALTCGFRVPLTLTDEAESFDLMVTAFEVDANGSRIGPPVEIGHGRVMSPKAVEASFARRDSAASSWLSAFPHGVEAAVAHIWPETRPAGADALAQRVTAAKVKELFARTARVASPAELTSYIRFLTAIRSHFQFVVQYFPTMNQGRTAADKDLCATPNSSREMLSIANHLYVLKSYGVAGDFAEFGCFKGFSSAMLSYACSLLGVKMHIFDSFAGLPASESKYYKAGDFRGSLEEVRRNIAQFGALACVEFHEGYFSESVPRTRGAIDRLAMLWMDVDLYDSAKGVMGMFDKLDPRGAVFSHECGPGFFVDGRLAPRAPSPDDPLPAILDAFMRAQAEPLASYIYGTTSAFWPRGDGVPVLDSEALMDIIASV